jgi:probable selenium-dependent hydroxylase accessory protein YqeC
VTSLREIFALQGGGVVSLVGGGGKTTLLFRLAAEIASSGQSVLTTTTTKILMPRHEQSAQIIISPHVAEVLKQAELILSCGSRHITAAAYLDPQHKLKGFDAGDIGKLRESGLFPWILVEADGAAQRPLKAPAVHEPLIPPCSRWVIAVAGLDAVGKPLTEEWVFRSRLFAALTGLAPGAVITESSVAAILSHEAGIMKGSPPGAWKCVFLNKAETAERKEAGRRIAGYLKAQGGIRPDMVVIGAAAKGLEICERFNLSGKTTL